MKKMTFILLVLCICIGICACGKSEAAQAVDDLIANIGTVTLENEQAILEAEDAVSALSEKERGQLENIELLEAARNTYNDLVAEQAAQIDDMEYQQHRPSYECGANRGKRLYSIL